jgi:hypothetical protein
MQAKGMAPKAPSIIACINLHLNKEDACLKADVDGTSDITKHDKLRIH